MVIYNYWIWSANFTGIVSYFHSFIRYEIIFLLSKSNNKYRVFTKNVQLIKEHNSNREIGFRSSFKEAKYKNAYLRIINKA